MPDESRTQPLVLVVDDDPSILQLVAFWLEGVGYSVRPFASGEACLAALGTLMPDVVCLDISLPGMSGLDALARIRANHRLLPVVMMTGDTSVNTVVAAMNLGAYDYLAKPIQQAKLITTLRNAVEHARLQVRLTHLEREAEGRGYPNIIGKSEAMKRLFRQMDRVAASDITVLIHGESGSGKELVAQAIHETSGRAKGPFVALNCAAIPETLQESELFGYERGAFTGAAARRMGRFEQAHGGTFFLDEVAELSPALQAKLLRVIQERSFTRIGGNEEIHSDFRLLTASHKRLHEQVERGLFREDFYFRVAVFELDVPPLRARGDDVVLLAHHFMHTFARELKSNPSLAPESLSLFRAYEWPGNVRELQNAIHRAMVVCDDIIKPQDLPSRVRASEYQVGQATVESEAVVAPQGHSNAARTGESIATHHPSGEPLSLEEIEVEAIRLAMARNGDAVGKVVKELGIGRTTLYRKLKRLG